MQIFIPLFRFGVVWFGRSIFTPYLPKDMHVKYYYFINKPLHVAFARFCSNEEYIDSVQADIDQIKY